MIANKNGYAEEMIDYEEQPGGCSWFNYVVAGLAIMVVIALSVATIYFGGKAFEGASKYESYLGRTPHFKDGLLAEGRMLANAFYDIKQRAASQGSVPEYTIDHSLRYFELSAATNFESEEVVSAQVSMGVCLQINMEMGLPSQLRSSSFSSNSSPDIWCDEDHLVHFKWRAWSAELTKQTDWDPNTP